MQIRNTDTETKNFGVGILCRYSRKEQKGNCRIHKKSTTRGFIVQKM